MKTNTKHNHHYVPRFYLKYWANKENKVWVYEKNQISKNRRPNPSLLHIDKVCTEENLFLVGDSLALEDWADKNIETKCGQVFKKIIAKKQINQNDVLYVKAFLSLTMSRHPLMEESSIELFNVNPQEVQPQNPLAQTIKFRMQVSLIEFEKLNLQIIYIPNEIETSFITSDVPFFIVADPIKSSKPELENSFRPEFNYAWFPISPKTLVFLSKREFSSQYENINDVARIRNINLELAYSANKILIGNEPSIFKTVS